MALPVTVGSGASLKSNLDGSDHVVVHSEDTTQRAALLAAFQTLPTGAATQATLASLLAKVISAPATEAKQDALFNAIRPATGHAAVTPSDTVDLATPSRAIYIGGAGNIVVTVGGADVTYAVAAGTTLNVVASRIKATSTTATGIVNQF